MTAISTAGRKIYPASTTKLLNILYAQTLLPLDRVVQPGNELEMVREGSSIAFVRAHHKLTVEMLIEGMLLPSGNDAAHVLAAAAGKVLDPDAKDGKAAVAAFVKGMNAYAASLGLTGSVFVSPDGFHDPAHYTTLEDLAAIADLAYADPVIRKYCKLQKDDVVYASGHLNTWVNTNKCLDPESEFYLPEVNGLKTGAINSTNSCLIASAVIDGRTFIFGFFGEKTLTDRFVDTAAAIAWVRETVL